MSQEEENKEQDIKKWKNIFLISYKYLKNIVKKI